MSTFAPVSVVIPAHNAAAFLEEAIRSVQAQTLQVAETIVIADDCSDRTAQIAADLGATVLEQTRRNMAAGLNLGVKISTQPWIAFLDADDYWAADKIASQWEAIEACSTAAIVSCDVFTVLGPEIKTRSQRHLQERWKQVSHITMGDDCRLMEKVDGSFLTRFFIATPTVMLRRDALSAIGFFDESLLFGQTLEFFARVLARYPLAFVERPLVYHRIHDGSHTMNSAGYWNSYLSMVDRLLKSPQLYPSGAGEAFRTQVKERFHQWERHLASPRQSRV